MPIPIKTTKKVAGCTACNPAGLCFDAACGPVPLPSATSYCGLASFSIPRGLASAVGLNSMARAR